MADDWRRRQHVEGEKRGVVLRLGREKHRHEERLHGWPARIFQHETDHLSGEVYIDRAEIRSLSSDENLADLWCEDPVPTEAAEELGFDL